MPPSEETLRSALKTSISLGHNNLASMYAKMLDTMTRPVKSGMSARPKIYFIVDFKGSCVERISLKMASHLSEYDCHLIMLGDDAHRKVDGDLYVYRNISWIDKVVLPREAEKKIFAVISGEKVLETGYGKHYSRVRSVVPLNRKLKLWAESFGNTNIGEPIPNGIDTDLFRPADRFPDEFVVGAAGNFYTKHYDDWKGFSKYVVPACKRAGVRLEWVGWKGECPQSGLFSKQMPLEEMGAWYRGLSCLVTMSRSEGCSGVTWEALASGLPVISSRTGWHSEQVDNGILWVDRPKDADETPEAVEKAISAIADNITRLKECHDMHVYMGRQARAFAEQWPWDVVMEKWRVAIREALDRTSK